MLESPKNDLIYLLGILTACAKANLYSRDFNSAKDFFEDDNQKTFNASLMQLSQVGECANKLSKDILGKYNFINWSSIIGLRNIIVHSYKRINYKLIFEIIKLRIPEFENHTFEIISNELKLKSFDIEEFEIAKSSTFYKNIDFSKLVL